MKQIQLRGGTTLEHMDGPNGSGFVGLPREITVDTNLWTIRVHDGLTKGGILLVKANDVYTRSQVDQLVVDIVAGGSISLDGYATLTQLNTKADSEHTHNNYCLASHIHNEYSSISHTHQAYDITFEDGQTLKYKFDNNLLSNVDMSNYITFEEFNAHEHYNYSLDTHEHTNYSFTNHTHDYAEKTHSHADYVEVGELNIILNEKANTRHIHNSDDININNINIVNYINNVIEEVISLLIPEKKEFFVGEEDWVYISEECYKYNCKHDLKTYKINVNVYDDKKISYVDVEYVSIDEIIIVKDNNKECNIIVSSLL